MIEKPNENFKYIVFTLWIVLSCTVIFAPIGDLLYRHFIINHCKTPYFPLLCPVLQHPASYFISIIPIFGPIFCKSFFFDRYSNDEKLELVKHKFAEQNKRENNLASDIYEEQTQTQLESIIEKMGGTTTYPNTSSSPTDNINIHSYLAKPILSTEYKEAMN